MKKDIICILITAMLSIFAFEIVSSQEDMTVVDNSDFSNPQRPPSVFKHDAHNEAAEIEACNVCHHVYEDGKLLEDESSEDQRCSDCHEINPGGGQPSLRKAFHMNCKGCHRDLKQGPVMCGKCHVK